jgi:Tol biopolymer transport system component
MLVISTPAGRLDAEIPLPSWLPESATQARWSSDGRRIAVAYGGETPRAMTIDVIDIDTRERHRVVSGVPFAYPRWGPSGDWLYYQEDRSIRRYRLSDGARQLAYSAAGFGIQLNGGFDLAVADGTLAILATRPGTPGCVIRVVEASGASVDRHTFAEACRAIAWSRDATRILVSTMSASGLPSLWVLDRQAGDPIRLPIEAEVFHDLSISPSGDQLLFSAGNPTFLSVMVSGLQRASR